MKWIYDLYVSKVLLILEIFGQQIAARGCVRSRYNQGVPPREAITILNSRPCKFQDCGACGNGLP